MIRIVQHHCRRALARSGRPALRSRAPGLAIPRRTLMLQTQVEDADFSAFSAENFLKEEPAAEIGLKPVPRVQIYGYQRCPHTISVQTSLEYLQVPYEFELVNPITKAPLQNIENLAPSDMVKIPVAVIDGQPMAESSDIISTLVPYSDREEAKRFISPKALAMSKILAMQELKSVVMVKMYSSRKVASAHFPELSSRDQFLVGLLMKWVTMMTKNVGWKQTAELGKTADERVDSTLRALMALKPAATPFFMGEQASWPDIVLYSALKAADGEPVQEQIFDVAVRLRDHYEAIEALRK